MSITKESAFEANIEAHLLAHGWHSVAPAAYAKKTGVFGEELIAFVQKSQAKAVAGPHAAIHPVCRAGAGRRALRRIAGGAS